MKKLIFGLSLAMTMIFPNVSNAQFNFSVNPGFSYNGASFGYKVGNFLPYAAFSYYGGNGSYSYSGTEFDYDTYTMQEFEEVYEIGLHVMLPTIGTKYYFLNGDLKAYGNANVTVPVLKAKFVDNGVEDPDVQDYLDNFSVILGEVGFGAEYHFAPQFSISGEFGFRWLSSKYEDTYDSQVYNENTGAFETHEFTNSVKGFVSPTYTRIGLNFYFGNGGAAAVNPN